MFFGRCFRRASANQHRCCPLITRLRTLLGISRQSYFSSCAHSAVKPFVGFNSSKSLLTLLLLPSPSGYTFRRTIYNNKLRILSSSSKATALTTAAITNGQRCYNLQLPDGYSTLSLSTLIRKTYFPFHSCTTSKICNSNNIINKIMAPLVDIAPKNYGRTDVQLSKQLIYCNGPLLDAVQQSKMFHDCKHFVDMPLKIDPSSTLEDWQNLVNSGKLDDLSLRMFIEKHFDEPGGELDEIQPVDFNPDCSFDNIACPSYRRWAKDLHQKWPMLCRKESETALEYESGM